MKRLQLKFIGHFLFSERVFQKLSIAQVSDATCIRSDILRSLERGDPPQELADTYIRSFIKAYAKLLGIGAEHILGSPEQTHYVYDDEKGAHVPPSGIPRLNVLIISAVATLLLATIIGFFVLPSFKEGNTEISEVKQELSYEDIPSSSEEHENATQYSYKIKATEDSWIIIKDDNKYTLVNKLFRKDDEIDVTDKMATLSVGNAGGVIVTYDKGESAPLGRSQEVLNNISLKPNNLLELVQKSK